MSSVATDHWGFVASVIYIPLKPTSTTTIKAVDGTVLAPTRAELTADPIISYLALSYRF